MRGLTAIVGIVLATSAVATGCDIGGCPAALITGVLAREGGELILTDVYEGNAPDEHVQWPSGHRLEDRNGRLVVVDFFGSVKAGEGDAVRLGGGEGTSGVWGVCGLLEVASPAP